MDFGSGGTNQRFYGANGHRDLTWTAGSTGTVTATIRSDPWGVPGTATGGSLPDFRFQGSWYDMSSAPSWVITRWYASSLGRFVSEDTLLGRLEHPVSRHLYAYGEGEPIRKWDPDGRATIDGSDKRAGFWYRVKAGDTKTSIAWRHMGDESWWPRMFNLNRARMRAGVYQGSCLWIPKTSYGPTQGPNQCNEKVYDPAKVRLARGQYVQLPHRRPREPKR